MEEAMTPRENCTSRLFNRAAQRFLEARTKTTTMGPRPCIARTQTSYPESRNHQSPDHHPRDARGCDSGKARTLAIDFLEDDAACSPVAGIEPGNIALRIALENDLAHRQGS